MIIKNIHTIRYQVVLIIVVMLGAVNPHQLLQANKNVIARVADSQYQQLPTVYLNVHKFNSNDLALLRETKTHPADQHLSFTKVNDDDLAHIKNLEEITVLRLRNTQITNAGLRTIKKMNSLVELDLSRTKITNAGMIHLKGLTKLEVLNLTGTKVTDAGLIHIAGMTNLKNLWLNHNLTDKGMVHLNKMKELQFLSIPMTTVSDVGLQQINGCQMMEELNIASTRITGSGLIHIRQFNKLKKLSLGQLINDAGLKYLGRLTNLQELSFIGTVNFTADGLRHLAKLSNLKKLTFIAWENGLADAEITEISKLTNLEVLNLGGYSPDVIMGEKLKFKKTELKQITDSGMRHLKNLKKLKRIQLQSAKVTIEGLLNLKELNNLEHLNIFGSAYIRKWADESEEGLSKTEKFYGITITISKLKDADLLQLKDFKKLKSLSVYGTKVTKKGLAYFKAAMLPRNMLVNEANSNKLHAQMLSGIKGIKNPIVLNLTRIQSGVPVGDTTDDGLAALEGIENLKELKLSTGNVTEKGLRSLGKLTSLEKIDLGVSVTNAGSTHLNGLTNLKVLSISRVYPMLNTFKKLESLTLNSEKGLSQITGLKHLKKIRFTNFDSTDVCLAEIKKFKSLESLTIQRAKFTVAGMKHFAEMKNLKKIDFGETIPPEEGLAYLKGLKHLEVLKIRDLSIKGLSHLSSIISIKQLFFSSGYGERGITDEDLIHLKGMKNLEELGISNCIQINGTGLKHISGLRKLKKLTLDRRRFTNAGMVHIKELTNLEILNIPEQVTDTGLANIAGLTKLKRLRMYDCTKITDAGMAHLKELKKLEYLMIGFCPITDKGLKHLRGLTKLEELAIIHTKITGTGLRNIIEIKSLKHLDLWASTITDAGLSQIGKMKQLDYLELYTPYVTDAGFVHLRGLHNLRELRMYHMSITDAAIDHLIFLKNLKIFKNNNEGNRTFTYAGLHKLASYCRNYYLGTGLPY